MPPASGNGAWRAVVPQHKGRRTWCVASTYTSGPRGPGRVMRPGGGSGSGSGRCAGHPEGGGRDRCCCDSLLLVIPPPVPPAPPVTPLAVAAPPAASPPSSSVTVAPSETSMGGAASVAAGEVGVATSPPPDAPPAETAAFAGPAFDAARSARPGGFAADAAGASCWCRIR